jgi:heme exporter protein D
MTIASLGPHAGFIIAAYAIFFVVVVGLIVWVILDGVAQRRQLAALDARGIRRRSDSVAAQPDQAPTRAPEKSGSTA